MSNVQRWTSPNVSPNDAGGFVSYGDYLELERQLAASEEARKKAENELAKAFSTLSICGVPQERARRVANGIEVLVTRMDREILDYKQRAEAAEQRIKASQEQEPFA